MKELTEEELQNIKRILEREGLTRCILQRELIFVEHNISNYQKIADLCVQMSIQMMLGAHINREIVYEALRRAIREEKKRV